MQEIGFAAYLTKPVRSSQLYDALVEVMGRKVPVPGKSSPSTPPLVTQYSLRESKKHRIRVLLAEDVLVNQKVATILLEKAGYRVDVVENGKEAVEAVRQLSYAAVFMDVQMPEMDGFEATGVIRGQEELSGHHVPIIAMTAHALEGDRERCLDAGMDDYIAKPLQPKELIATLEKWLG
jgi:CheY-like chemotaxis protein